MRVRTILLLLFPFIDDDGDDRGGDGDGYTYCTLVLKHFPPICFICYMYTMDCLIYPSSIFYYSGKMFFLLLCVFYICTYFHNVNPIDYVHFNYVVYYPRSSVTNRTTTTTTTITRYNEKKRTKTNFLSHYNFIRFVL